MLVLSPANAFQSSPGATPSPLPGHSYVSRCLIIRLANLSLAPYSISYYNPTSWTATSQAPFFIKLKMTTNFDWNNTAINLDNHPYLI